MTILTLKRLQVHKKQRQIEYVIVQFCAYSSDAEQIHQATNIHPLRLHKPLHTPKFRQGRLPGLLRIT